MVETGELYKMVKFAMKDGHLVKEEVTITGQKFPLIKI